MTSFANWVAGARPRTLPAAVAPVLAGVAAAIAVDPAAAARSWLLPILATLLSLALQIGVNYANDYSDGVRGTDDDRVGPLRLTASGLATPKAVKAAAFGSFVVAAVIGLVIVTLTGHWWLLALGAAAIAAGWFYTGGPKPYGYLGLGELMVFLFFGLAAGVGTTYIMIDAAPAPAWLAAVAAGSLASAILVVNNLRDIPTDIAAGKRTLATRMGDRGTRWFYLALAGLAAIAVIWFAALTNWLALLGLLGLAVLLPRLKPLLSGAAGRRLIPMIQATSAAELLVAIGLLAGVGLGR
ncbi:MAG: 1,4-dihydroxy-2-naphthoate polyprenyltransferase [Arachnia propionica]|nr:MAG: 1,4-dihydroxy-2-naphthoate polyprenyltransferase [Arachnia propionica]